MHTKPEKRDQLVPEFLQARLQANWRYIVRSWTSLPSTQVPAAHAAGIACRKPGNHIAQNSSNAAARCTLQVRLESALHKAARMEALLQLCDQDGGNICAMEMKAVVQIFDQD
eukprot:scaffold138103_cov14-Tisochrysis_lutea.AAC.1